MIYFYQQISKNHIGDVLVSVLDASNKVDRGFNDGEAVSVAGFLLVPQFAFFTNRNHGHYAIEIFKFKMALITNNKLF